MFLRLSNRIVSIAGVRELGWRDQANRHDLVASIPGPTTDEGQQFYEDHLLSVNNKAAKEAVDDAIAEHLSRGKPLCDLRELLKIK